MRSHLKVYFSFEEDTQALTDEERARLLLAMLRYAKDGTEVDLTGNERFLFPVFRAQIDRDIETYEVKVTNGSKGGRPKTAKEKEEPKETEENQTEPKITEDNLNSKIEDRRQKIEDKRQKVKDGKERFTPPTVDEVREYCEERGNKVNPERFVDFYASKGWKVGNQTMKDWKACVRTWEQRDNQTGQNQSKITPLPAQSYTQRDYSEPAKSLESLMRAMGEL